MQTTPYAWLEIAKLPAVGFSNMKLVLAVVLLLIANAGAQDCTIAQLITSLETLVQDSLAAGTPFSNPTLNILDQNIVCLVTDTMRGNYSLTSVVVNYTCSGLACPELSESFSKQCSSSDILSSSYTSH